MSQRDFDCVLVAIHSLRNEIENNPDEIENLTLDSYLEAMAAWLEGYQKKYDEPLTWELVTRMIRAASIYE